MTDSAENNRNDTVKRGKGGLFAAGTAAGPGRPAGSGQSNYVDVQILGKDGQVMQRADVFDAFDAAIPVAEWQRMIEKMKDSVISHGSVRAFEALTRFRFPPLKADGASSVDVFELLRMVQNHGQLVEMSDNAELSDIEKDD